VQNLLPRADRRVLTVLIGTLITVLALALDINSYSDFLLVIGSVFVAAARGRRRRRAGAAGGASGPVDDRAVAAADAARLGVRAGGVPAGQPGWAGRLVGRLALAAARPPG